MGRTYDEDEEEHGTMSEEEARRLVEWVIAQGLTKEKAYEALAVTMGAAVEKKE